LKSHGKTILEVSGAEENEEEETFVRKRVGIPGRS